MSTLKGINEFVTVQSKDFNSCIAVIEHDLTIQGMKANLRFHHLKFDGNGLPMIKKLAETLYEYIIDFCDAVSNFEDKLGMVFMQLHENFSYKEYDKLKRVLPPSVVSCSTAPVLSSARYTS